MNKDIIINNKQPLARIQLCVCVCVIISDVFSIIIHSQIGKAIKTRLYIYSMCTHRQVEMTCMVY